MTSQVKAKEKKEVGVVEEKVEREHISFLRNYHSSMLEAMEAAGTDFQSDCKWLRSVIKCLPSASSMRDEEE